MNDAVAEAATSAIKTMCKLIKRMIIPLLRLERIRDGKGENTNEVRPEQIWSAFYAMLIQLLGATRANTVCPHAVRT